MSISSIDLNLFTVFDAIYREGGITAASKHLHLSQPAVSHALSRLRELLRDPLFERQGNAMIPTPRARALAGTVSSSLGNLEQLLSREAHFDPAGAQRNFVIATRDAHESSFMPELARTLAERPGIDVAAVRIERRDLEDDLQSGEIDLALDVGLPLPAEIKREQVSSAPLLVLARRDHPQLQGAIDLDTYLALEHILVTGRRRGGGFEDLALARLNLTRRVRVRCQLHAAANELVRRSDLLLTLPRNDAEQLSQRSGNQLLAFPAEIPNFELFLYWHANVDDDPANRWFRALVRDALAAPDS